MSRDAHCLVSIRHGRRVSSRVLTLLTLLACGALGCASSARDHTETPGATPHAEQRSNDEPGASGSARPVASQAPAPPGDNRASQALERPELLPVPGFAPAVVIAPAHAEPVPLLIATHGAGGAPEWDCDYWSGLAKGRWLVVCPRGVALRRGQEGSYYYPDHLALEREVTAVVKATEARYGAKLLATGGVYAGYSQGATMGALMVIAHGTRFPHLILLEGGSRDWTLSRAERYRKSGGQSVFIACGTPSCDRSATESVRVLARAGLRAENEYAPGAGHTGGGEVGAHAAKHLELLGSAASTY